MNIYCSVIQEHLDFTFPSSCSQSQYKNKMKTLGVLGGVMCFALVIISQTRANQVLNFTASPSVINLSNPDALTLRCDIIDGATTGDVGDFTLYYSLSIFHKVCCQRPIATVTPGKDAIALDQYFFSETINVTGYIPLH